MYFESLMALWQMDGHGPYVWSAYGITAAVLVALVWFPLRRKRDLMSLLRIRQRRQSS